MRGHDAPPLPNLLRLRSARCSRRLRVVWPRYGRRRALRDPDPPGLAALKAAKDDAALDEISGHKAQNHGLDRLGREDEGVH